MRCEKGFTIVELLVVMAISGILITIAVPSYTSYLNKAKLLKAYSSVSILKAQALEYYFANTSWPSSITDLVSTPASLTSKELDSVDVSEDCTETPEFCLKAKINKAITGHTSSFIQIKAVVADGLLDWVCSVDNIPKNILPLGCS